MHILSGVYWAVGLVGMATSAIAADSAVYIDSETQFRFQQFNAMYGLGTGQSIAYRIAVPSPASSGSNYDMVIQISAPVGVGWAGLAWSGRMTTGPLLVAWRNGNSAVVSSRTATSHSQPTVLNGGPTYQILKTGTKVNGTHWQVTAKCSGCSSFTSRTGVVTNLNPGGSSRFAFAMSLGAPYTPSNPASGFPYHEVQNPWTHDLSQAGNANFAQLVQKNA